MLKRRMVYDDKMRGRKLLLPECKRGCVKLAHPLHFKQVLYYFTISFSAEVPTFTM